MSRWIGDTRVTRFSLFSCSWSRPTSLSEVASRTVRERPSRNKVWDSNPPETDHHPPSDRCILGPTFPLVWVWRSRRSVLGDIRRRPEAPRRVSDSQLTLLIETVIIIKMGGGRGRRDSREDEGSRWPNRKSCLYLDRALQPFPSPTPVQVPCAPGPSRRE